MFWTPILHKNDMPFLATRSLLDRSGPMDDLLAAAERTVLGKSREIRLAVACLLANGHLLIEDRPGVGKTTLAHTLACLFGLRFSRIQFTSDLLPADITGVSVFDRAESSFRFVPGPIFAELVLADEINRATPKTQSALLEAMAEGQVTSDGETRRLPDPFFVIATQNPSQQIGTFPLPESQLDRFLMRIELGYPDPEAERALLSQRPLRTQPGTADPLFSPEMLCTAQQAVHALTAAPALIAYVQALLQSTRQDAQFVHGLSPRAGLALLAAARAWAWLAGRTAVLPDDVQAVFPAVAQHRLQPALRSAALPGSEAVRQLLQSVPIP